jgi:hypothetical protein
LFHQRINHFFIFKAIIFPSQIEIRGVCIESYSLKNESEIGSVDNLLIDECSSEKLRNIMSLYRVNQQYNLSATEDMIKLSEIKTILTIDLNKIVSNEVITESVNFEIKKSQNNLDGLLYWFQFGQEMKEDELSLKDISKEMNNKLLAITFHDDDDDDDDNDINTSDNQASNLNVQIILNDDFIHLKLNLF